MTSTWACRITQTKVRFQGKVREVKILVTCNCKVWLEHRHAHRVSGGTGVVGDKAGMYNRHL